MAYSQGELDALRKIYASGLLSTEYAGRRMTFQSRADLRATIADIERELSPSTSAPARTVGKYSSGLQG